MRVVPFKQVDVFTQKGFYGNPVAVVFDADELSTEQMQRIANWTNLSETTFVLAPTQPNASYRLRIFTPAQELPFAGHPSVGSAHAILEAGWAAAKDGVLIQECTAGLLRIRSDGDGADRRLFVQVPEAKIGEPDMALTHALGKALGQPLRINHPPLAINVGPTWMIADLETESAVRLLKPNFAALAEICREFELTGVTVFGKSLSEATPVVVRSFVPDQGIPEDPVCGSGNASVAAYLHATGQTSDSGEIYTASQGREIGRNGFVEVVISGNGEIEIGGSAVTVVDGAIRI